MILCKTILPTGTLVIGFDCFVPPVKGCRHGLGRKEIILTKADGFVAGLLKSLKRL